MRREALFPRSCSKHIREETRATSLDQTLACSSEVSAIVRRHCLPSIRAEAAQVSSGLSPDVRTQRFQEYAAQYDRSFLFLVVPLLCLTPRSAANLERSGKFVRQQRVVMQCSI